MLVMPRVAKLMFSTYFLDISEVYFLVSNRYDCRYCLKTLQLVMRMGLDRLRVSKIDTHSSCAFI